MVPLEKEIKMIQDYMALEKIRYSDQMEMTVDIIGDHENKMIAPLLLIPFVENSFKHGASKMITQPWVSLYMRIENDRLNFIIKNSKPTTDDPATTKGNIGLKNVKKRLALLYPANHELNIINEPGCYSVSLHLQLYDVVEKKAITNELKPQHKYAVA
jgi:LytS/YehU family sensor histidine kinase